MPKVRKAVDALDAPRLWAAQWMDQQPWDAAWMESRTAFVRAQDREPPMRRTAAEWADRWTAWLTRPL